MLYVNATPTGKTRLASVSTILSTEARLGILKKYESGEKEFEGCASALKTPSLFSTRQAETGVG